MFYGRKAKSYPNDKLYSEIIRMPGYCFRCGKTSNLTCAHIMKRRHYHTRFLLKPKPNAIPLCTNCHSWFDTHMIMAVLLDPKKRVFNHTEESFTFLVEKCGYSWGELLTLLAKSKETFTNYKGKKDQINIQLKEARAEILGES